MTDLTPGLTMAQQNSRELRGSGNGWRGPRFANPTFAPPAAFEFANDCGLNCGNCGSGATKRTGPTQRQCIKCAVTWQTQAITEEERRVEAFREKEAAK